MNPIVAYRPHSSVCVSVIPTSHCTLKVNVYVVLIMYFYPATKESNPLQNKTFK